MKIDLGALVNETLDLILEGENIVSIDKASKKLYIEFEQGTEKINSCKNVEDLVEATEELVLKILNNNSQGKVFDINKLKELKINVTAQGNLIATYGKFITTFTNNPN